jgi:A/G-specific adenine glycosylase
MTRLAKLLLDWYQKNARELPWRNHPDPYAIWISEIMLQQTQVATVIPYFMRWMDKLPSVSELARADERDVLSLWEGLGYYSRARSLLKAAHLVMVQFGGQIPSSVDELLQLPGVGRYTAAAISSMAFGRDEAALDGNIKRVFARVYGVTVPADSTAGEKALWQIADRNLPEGQAGDYNQALMDLGALLCLPQNPLCGECPLRLICAARRKGVQADLPGRRKKAFIPTRIKAAAVIIREESALLIQRPSKGLLGGMWEFPAAEVKKDPRLELPQVIEKSYGIRISKVSFLDKFIHAYSHFKLTEHAFLCTLKTRKHLPEPFLWVPLSDLRTLPMGKVDRLIAGRLLSEHG